MRLARASLNQGKMKHRKQRFKLKVGLHKSGIIGYYRVCVNSDNSYLCYLANNHVLCANSDIDVLCDLAHNDVEGVDYV